MRVRLALLILLSTPLLAQSAAPLASSHIRVISNDKATRWLEYVLQQHGTEPPPSVASETFSNIVIGFDDTSRPAPSAPTSPKSPRRPKPRPRGPRPFYPAPPKWEVASEDTSSDPNLDIDIKPPTSDDLQELVSLGSLEVYRGTLENFRTTLERKRATHEIKLDKYTIYMSEYRRRIDLYQDVTKALNEGKRP